MERNIQIIVAASIGSVGIIFGVLFILFAVRYRRRLKGENKGDAVMYRNQRRRIGADDRSSEADDRISMQFGKTNIRNHDNFSLASNYSKTSRPTSFESVMEVQLRPKLSQASWKQKSSRSDRRFVKSEISREQTEKELYEDVKERRKSSRRKQNSRLNSKLNDCAGQELVTIVRRHSECLGKNIPRPIVRSCKSELYENAETIYDFININEH